MRPHSLAPARRPPARLAALRAALFAGAAAGLAPAACDRTPTAPPVIPGEPANAAAAVPGVLVGEWTTREGITPATFWEDHARDFARNAVVLQFSFDARGRYVSRLYAIGREFDCVQQVWIELHGDVTFGAGGTPAGAAPGGSFVTRPSDGRLRGTDTCRARNNYDRRHSAEELAAEARTYAWALEPGTYAGTTVLAVRRDAGTPVVFARP